MVHSSSTFPASHQGKPKRFGAGWALVLLLLVQGQLRAGPAAPAKQENHHELGLASFNERDWNQAIAQFTQAIRLNPRDAWAYNYRALARENSGDLEGAGADFRMAVAINPRDAGVYVNCGRLLQFGKQELDIAIADYTEAIRLAPTNADTFITRARAHLAKKEFVQAVYDCNSAIQLQPTKAGYYSDRAVAEESSARALSGLGDQNKVNEGMDQALNDWHQAAALDAQYLWELGQAEKQQGRYAAAVADMTQYLQAHPDDFPGREARAQACEAEANDFADRDEPGKRQAAWDQALAEWNQLVLDSHQASDILCARGDFHARSHQFAEALADYKHAVELQPANPDTLTALGSFLATCPDPSFRDGPQALAATRKAYADGRHNSVFSQAGLAAALAETGDFDQAVKFQKLALQALETSGRILETAGLARPEALRSDLVDRLALYEWNRPCHKILGLAE